MEIKCSSCDVIPNLDIYDSLQAIKFICKDKDSNNITHYGLLSINNFYKNFIENKDSNKFLNKFIEEIESNPNNKDNSTSIPSISYFIQFTIEFDKLLNMLKQTYENFKQYFYKILYIKKLIYKESNKSNEKEEIYYSHTNIINKMKEMIDYINNVILIKEEFPKILNNEEINLKINEIIKSKKINKNNFDLNEIKKDFEYKNSLENNICIKKPIKFENDESFNGLLIKLNEELSPANFIYSYQIKNVFNDVNSYFQVFDRKLNILMTEYICSEKIFQIMQLKDNSILIKLRSKIKFIKLDINNKYFERIQEIDSVSKCFIETLINNNEVSLLLQSNENYCFYKNYKEKEPLYKKSPFKLSTKIKGDELFFIDNFTFISLFRKEIRFYEIITKSNNEPSLNQIDIKKTKRIVTNHSILSGIQFIGQNNQNVIIGSLEHLFLMSCKYKEIVTIYHYYKIGTLYKGINNECYICLNDWVSSHKIVRQVNIDKEGNLIVEGNNYFEKIDFYIKQGFIDLGDTICYIEDKMNE